MRSRLTVIGISLLAALLTLLPYGLAYADAGGYRFTGFLFNPYDAASYLAKIRQGYDGRILYTLAFTENPGPGALFFPYYLILGHLARLLQLPLIAIWHAARILGGAFFLTAAWEFFGRIGLSPAPAGSPGSSSCSARVSVSSSFHSAPSRRTCGSPNTSPSLDCSPAPISRLRAG
jgi:hypothetical protein